MCWRKVSTINSFQFRFRNIIKCALFVTEKKLKSELSLYDKFLSLRLLVNHCRPTYSENHIEFDTYFKCVYRFIFVRSKMADMGGYLWWSSTINVFVTFKEIWARSVELVGISYLSLKYSPTIYFTNVFTNNVYFTSINTNWLLFDFKSIEC